MTVSALGIYYAKAGLANNVKFMKTSVFVRMYFATLTFLLIYQKKIGSWIMPLGIEHLLSSAVTAVLLVGGDIPDHDDNDHENIKELG